MRNNKILVRGPELFPLFSLCTFTFFPASSVEGVFRVVYFIPVVRLFISILSKDRFFDFVVQRLSKPGKKNDKFLVFFNTILISPRINSRVYKFALTKMCRLGRTQCHPCPRKVCQLQQLCHPFWGHHQSH